LNGHNSFTRLMKPVTRGVELVFLNTGENDNPTEKLIELTEGMTSWPWMDVDV